MCALPIQADPAVVPASARVLRCERVEAGSHAALIRVTVLLGGLAPSSASGARLVVEDRGRERRCETLPAPVAEHAERVTLGFAVTTSAVAGALELGGEQLALPALSQPASSRSDVAVRAVTQLGPAGADAGPRPRGLMHDDEPRAVARTPLAVETSPAAAPESPRRLLRERGRAALEAQLRDAERQLHTTQARLEESRSSALLVERERDAAQRAVARAEVAAHDATARAEGLARRTTSDGGGRPARRGSRRAAAAACALGSVAVLVAILAWPARDGAGDRGVPGVAAASANAADTRVARFPGAEALAARLQIPADYLVLYRQAGARYGLDWTRLAAVGAIESGHGQSSFAGILSGANHRGASGPAQFLPGTWERFGVDGDGDGERNPHDPADAIPAMASYLRASGAPQDWRAALRTYNHSDAYVTAVESLAATLRSNAS